MYKDYSHLREAAVVWQGSGIPTLWKLTLHLLFISHSGNQMFTHLLWENWTESPVYPPSNSPLSTCRRPMPSHAFPQPLCMLRLRNLSLCCSQAGNTSQPVQSLHARNHFNPCELQKTDVMSYNLCSRQWMCVTLFLHETHRITSDLDKVSSLSATVDYKLHFYLVKITDCHCYCAI